MTRNALRRYLYGLVVASLPACCRTHPEEHERVYFQDAAIIDSVDGGLKGGEALPKDVCGRFCLYTSTCSLSALDLGKPYIDCVTPAGESCGLALPGGRPPAGLRPAAIACADPLGAYWAYMAHVEGAAVYGFLQLADELQRLGAPPALIEAARAAAADERRHARIARRLAKGVAVPPVEIDPTPPRSPFQIALDNGTEGRVFETYGVLISLWQSQRAADRRVRAAFCRIAEDELRHAELAESVARWLEPQLSAGERRQIAAARRQAASQLARLVAQPVSEPLLRDAGLPPPEVARPWVREMTARLWS